MKLFQKLLLTPVALGLFSPMAANASEANLMDVSNYSQVDVEVSQDTFKPLSSKNPLLAGGEGLGSSNSDTDFDGDTFSSTTSATFFSNFLFGNTNGTSNEKSKFIFDYGINLNTSFTGNDSLDVEMIAGIENGSLLPEGDLKITDSQLKIDSISYTTTLGERLTLLVGNGTKGSALYAPSCAYTGITDTMDDCGVASTNLDLGLGSTFGASYDLGSGFSVAVGVESEDNAEGLLTDQSTDAYGAQVAYTADNYGVAIAIASIENNTDAVLSTGTAAGVTTSTAFSAYFTPDVDNLPSISVGFESSHNDASVKTSANDETSHYFVGVQWDDFGQGTLGASFGSKEATVENADAEMMYEVFYSYNYADGITITPAIYVKENSAANTDDETGLFLKTSFNF